MSQIRRNELNIDRIITSQPELGPFIPDGGYGWIILIASVFLQIFIPSILSSYGIFMLYSRIEGNAINHEPKLWDISLIPTPIIFMAVWTITDPWSRTIVASSTWPRLVTTTGIFLTCAGVLLQWVAIKESFGIYLYMLAGTLSGFGSSLALTQSEILINQYFRVKLLRVNNILACAYSLGFIIIPIILGFMIFTRGIMHSLLIYQAIILQCCIIISVFKKPMYLKAERRRYELLQNISEDDEMIFAKDIRDVSSNTNASTSRTINNIPIINNEQETTSSNTRSNRLKESFDMSNNGIPQNVSRNNPETNTEPTPIFTQSEITNGTSYTFDNNVDDENEIIALPPLPQRIITTTFKQEISFLWKFRFYKSLFFLISLKYSMLIFWIMFPTYLYVEMDQLKVQQTTFLVGSMGLGSLFVGLFSSFFPVMGKNKEIVTAVFCLLSSIGYFIVSSGEAEGWMLFGALLITSSITALHVLNLSLIKFLLRDDNEKAHTLLHTLCGISIVFLLVQDSTYKSCFRIMSLLQLTSGFVFLYGFLYNHFKNICSRS